MNFSYLLEFLISMLKWKCAFTISNSPAESGSLPHVQVLAFQTILRSSKNRTT